MIFSKDQFIKANQQLLEETKVKSKEEDGLFIDGPFNPSIYYESSPKILWILKEAYGEPVDYPDLLTNKFDNFFNDFLKGVPRHTWFPIAIISYCLLNKIYPYKPIDNIDSIKNEIQNAMQKIAFININKVSSETGGRSLDFNIAEASKVFEDCLNRQIDLYEPEIIICGNTFKYLKANFKFPKLIKEINGEQLVDHYLYNKKLIVDPYHPGYTAYNRIDKDLYINDILRTIRHYY